MAPPHPHNNRLKWDVLLNLQFIAALEPRIHADSIAFSNDETWWSEAGVSCFCQLWHRFGRADVERHFRRGADGLNMNDYPDQISFTSHCPHTHTSASAGCLAANGELLYAWRGMPQSQRRRFIHYVWRCISFLMWADTRRLMNCK